jgi:hypothetical protein
MISLIKFHQVSFISLIIFHQVSFISLIKFHQVLFISLIKLHQVFYIKFLIKQMVANSAVKWAKWAKISMYIFWMSELSS